MANGTVIRITADRHTATRHAKDRRPRTEYVRSPENEPLPPDRMRIAWIRRERRDERCRSDGADQTISTDQWI
ncbi:hypothetical protein CSQ87_01330 [Bifidobacterium simiarum]|uniref:Uncharacterized protein n=1 Tax=Bifidobacterium simiarum TaxID=2045441 RepID=A0A2M9HH84_9BIFI|nr:hypothetical protein CSQ87_01330 [Bifidobacterium simiarum]